MLQVLPKLKVKCRDVSPFEASLTVSRGEPFIRIVKGRPRSSFGNDTLQWPTVSNIPISWKLIDFSVWLKEKFERVDLHMTLISKLLAATDTANVLVVSVTVARAYN